MSDAPEPAETPAAKPRPQVGKAVGCGDCKFWHKVAAASGLCRAMPPTPLWSGLMAKNTFGQPVPMVATYWPETQPSMWCGCWQLRPDDLAAIDFSKLDEVEGTA